MNYLDLYVAESKMTLKDSNYCLSFVTTLWKGEFVMFTYNNLQNNITSFFSDQNINDSELIELENLVKRFIKENNNHVKKYI